MRSGWYLVCCLLAAAPAAAPADAGDWDLQSRLRNKTAYRLADSHRLSQFDNLVDVAVGRPLPGGFELDALVRARHEDRLEPTSFSQVVLREFTVSRWEAEYTLQLGRQQVIWGKTDGLRLLDVVNPLDLREFVLDDFADSRVPLWMANVELFLDEDSHQFLVIPDVEGDELPPPGAEFFLGPDLPPGVPVRVRRLDEPDESDPGNWGYGYRWSTRQGRLDLTVNALYDWNPQPVFFSRASPGGLELSPERRRRRLLGASGDLPLGGLLLRFETSWTPDAWVQSSGQGRASFTRNQSLSAAVGVDWITDNWLLSPQLFHTRLLDARRTVVADADDTFLTFLVRRKFMQDRMTFRLFALWGPEHDERWINPRLSYQFFGRLEVTLGADLFAGSREGRIGRFRDRDRVTLETNLRF